MWVSRLAWTLWKVLPQSRTRAVSVLGLYWPWEELGFWHFMIIPTPTFLLCCPLLLFFSRCIPVPGSSPKARGLHGCSSPGFLTPPTHLTPIRQHCSLSQVDFFPPINCVEGKDYKICKTKPEPSLKKEDDLADWGKVVHSRVWLARI